MQDQSLLKWMEDDGISRPLAAAWDELMAKLFVQFIIENEYNLEQAIA